MDQHTDNEVETVLLWHHSGMGEAETCPAITLDAVRGLAVRSGFVFNNAPPEASLQRRADLQGLFSAYGVNSFSKFKSMFTSRPLAAPLQAATNVSCLPTTRSSSAADKDSLCGCAISADDKNQIENKPAENAYSMPSTVHMEGPDGRQYEGEVQSGLPNGFGRETFELPGGLRAAYEGEFLDGRRQGMGVLTVEATGDKYIGAMKNGQPNGQGIFIFSGQSGSVHREENSRKDGGSNGTVYPGQDGITSASASLDECPDDGEDLPCPDAKLPAAESRHRIRFEGSFVQKPRGPGVMYWSNGSREIGIFQGLTCASSCVRGTSSVGHETCIQASIKARMNAEKALELQAKFSKAQQDSCQ